MQTYQERYNDLYNIGLTLSQVIEKLGLTVIDPVKERGCYTSVWVHHKLVRVYVRVSQ